MVHLDLAKTSYVLGSQEPVTRSASAFLVSAFHIDRSTESGANYSIAFKIRSILLRLVHAI